MVVKQLQFNEKVKIPCTECTLLHKKTRPKREATEKGVIPVLDAGIHLRKSLCCKEIDYRIKPDNDNFRSFSATS